MTQSNEMVIRNQTDILNEMIARHVQSGQRYALVDFPHHSNVGDSAIWLGELILLKQATGHDPDYVCTAANFDLEEFRRCCPEGPIFIHGGGNLGDIWESHQVLRETLLRTLKERAIIQLPQSIKFRQQARAATFAAAIAAHARFTLYVRDRQSMRFAEDVLDCRAHLVPDSAFAIGALNPPGPAKYDTFLLLRTDDERVALDQTPYASLPNTFQADWLAEPRSFGKRMRLVAAAKCLASLRFDRNERRRTLYEVLARRRVQRGLQMLSSGRSVITDRLHAHILSTLLDLPHVALDNDYGKISSYIAAWTAEYARLKTARSAQEAIEQLMLLRKHDFDQLRPQPVEVTQDQ